MNKKGGELTKHMEAHGIKGMPKREGGAHLQSRCAGKAYMRGCHCGKRCDTLKDMHTLRRLKGVAKECS